MSKTGIVNAILLTCSVTALIAGYVFFTAPVRTIGKKTTVSPHELADLVGKYAPLATIAFAAGVCGFLWLIVFNCIIRSIPPEERDACAAPGHVSRSPRDPAAGEEKPGT